MNKKILYVIFWISIFTSLLCAAILTTISRTTQYNGIALNSDLNASVIPDHIVLTWTHNPQTTQTITWRTIKSKGTEEVRYRVKGTENFTALSADIMPMATVSTNSQGTVNMFSATIEGLNPGTTYEYTVGDGVNMSPISTFKTEALNNTQTKILIFGDSQSGNVKVPEYGPWHDTVQKAFEMNPDANFMINMGDLVEQGQNYQHWNNWFSAAKGVIDRIPEMPVQGNHETYALSVSTSLKQNYFLNQFPVPNNGPQGFIGKTYSYDYANIHFVVLDSQEDEESPGDDNFLKTQAQWLEKDLMSNKQKWIIVMFHKTPYYIKKTRSNPAVKDIFTPIIEKYHVDIVLNGHDHGVARTFPINNGKYYTDFSKGTVYYITGRSGNKYYTDLTKKAEDAKFIDCKDSPCYEVAEIKSDALTIKSYKYSTINPSFSSPVLIDTLTIDKANAENSTKLTLK